MLKINYIEKLIDPNYKKNKSYWINGKWNKSRCRIDPALYIDSLYDYYFGNFKDVNSLCEEYLKITRNTNENFSEYKNSNSMDFYALKNLSKFIDKAKFFKENKDLNINELNETEIKYQMYEHLVKQINDYKLTNAIDMSIGNKGDSITNDEIQNYSTNKRVRNENKLSDFCIFSKITNYSFSNSSNEKISEFNINDTYKNVIGELGEKLVYDFLKEKYSESQIVWLRKEGNTFANHDFEIILGNGEKRFIEVKSTTKINIINFFLSRNEYEFYLKNEDRYEIWFMLNIKPNDKNSIPLLLTLDKPKIEISKDKCGFDKENNILYMYANSFFSSIRR